ncbi:hypothetical protein ACFOZ7_17875 [Natribaculum luteum]|uniref:Transposase n=1 Tax=Natribaculum luteum TaxID=1586232 RepID=A0ABD5P3Z9_9EURY|nr:hypothetical protein [Natribaculum luteum]
MKRKILVDIEFDAVIEGESVRTARDSPASEKCNGHAMVIAVDDNGEKTASYLWND